MSNHGNDGPALKAALKKSGLPVDTPSQLSDAFRLGWNTRQAPKVKALEWGDPAKVVDKPHISTAEDKTGDYSISWIGEKYRPYRRYALGPIVNNLEDAKAVAQADYERRILSALEE